MKKILKLLIGITSAISFVASSAFAALQLDVNTFGTVSIIPGEPIVNFMVAEITITADEPYRINMYSQNGTRLLMNGYAIPYTLRYDNGAALILSATPQVVETGDASRGSVRRGISVSIDGSASMNIPAGNYQDVITLELLAR